MKNYQEKKYGVFSEGFSKRIFIFLMALIMMIQIFTNSGYAEGINKKLNQPATSGIEFSQDNKVEDEPEINLTPAKNSAKESKLKESKTIIESDKKKGNVIELNEESKKSQETKDQNKKKIDKPELEIDEINIEKETVRENINKEKNDLVSKDTYKENEIKFTEEYNSNNKRNLYLDKKSEKDIKFPIKSEDGIESSLEYINDKFNIQTNDIFIPGMETGKFNENLILPAFIPIGPFSLGPFPGMEVSYEVGNFDYPNKIVWELKVNATNSSKYNKIWHNFTTTEDSGLGQPKITAINQNPVATGGEYNEFKTASIQGDLNTGETIYTIETPITKIKSHYLLDYHLTVDQGNSKINKAHLRLDAKKQTSSYTGEYISSSLVFLNSQNGMVDVADSAAPTEGELQNVAIIRNITGEYKDANTIIWRVSDTNVSKPQYDSQTDTYNYPEVNSEISFNIDESQEKISARQWKLKSSEELDDTNIGNKFIKYGEASPSKESGKFTTPNLSYGEIAQYEFETKVKDGEYQTQNHYFWTDPENKESTESGLKALKKYLTINKYWTEGSEKFDTAYSIKGQEKDGITSPVTIQAGDAQWKSQNPVFVYEDIPEVSNGFTSPRKQVTRQVEEIDIKDGYRLKEFISNHSEATYKFTNSQEVSGKCGDYGITHMDTIYLNQERRGGTNGSYFGWNGKIKGQLRTPKGMKAGEYFTLKLPDELNLLKKVTMKEPAFTITKKGTNLVLFNVYHVEQDVLRFIATDNLESAASYGDLNIDWVLGHDAGYPTSEEYYINGKEGKTVNPDNIPGFYKKVHQGVEKYFIEGGFTIDPRYAYNHEDKWKKTGYASGQVKKDLEFESTFNRNPECKNKIYAKDSVIHFEDTYMTKANKYVSKRVIEEGYEKFNQAQGHNKDYMQKYNGNILTYNIWEISYTLGNYSVSNGKQNDFTIKEYVRYDNTDDGSNPLWTGGVDSIEAYVTDDVDMFGGYEEKDLKSIPVSENSNLQSEPYVYFNYIKGGNVNPAIYSPTDQYTLTGKNLKEGQMLVLRIKTFFEKPGTYQGTATNGITFDNHNTGEFQDKKLKHIAGATVGSGVAKTPDIFGFSIQKTDDKGTPIKGNPASFSIYKKEGNDKKLILTEHTNNEGIINFNDLSPGEYVLVEVQAPNGYGIEKDTSGNPKEYQVNISATGQVTIDENPLSGNNPYQIKNSEEPNEPELGKAKFEVKKYNGSGNGLAGAKFTLIKDDSSYIKELTSKENENIVFDNLTPGNYSLTETEVPEGYEQASKTYEVKVTEDYQVIVTEKNDNRNKADVSMKDSSLDNNNLDITMQIKNPKERQVFKLKLDTSLKFGDLDSYYYPENIVGTDGKILAIANYNKLTNSVDYELTKNAIGQGEDKILDLDLNHTVGLNRENVLSSQNVIKPRSFSLFKAFRANEPKNEITVNYSLIGKDEVKANASIEVGYPKILEAGGTTWDMKPQDFMNLKHGVTKINTSTGKVEYILYLNPNDTVGPHNKQTSLYLSSEGGVDFNDKTKVEMYKVPNNSKESAMVDSMAFDTTNLEKMNNNGYFTTQGYKTGGSNTKKVDGNFTRINLDSVYFKGSGEVQEKNGYIVKVTTDYDQNVEYPGINFAWVVQDGSADVDPGDWHLEGQTQFTNPGKQSTLEYRVANHEKSNGFEILKVNQDGQTLANATFTLTKSDGTIINGEQITGTDGKISYTNLEEGDYILEETKAPEGYIISEGKWKVKVAEDGVNITDMNDKPVNFENGVLTVTNSKAGKGKFTVNKQGFDNKEDTTPEPLSGVVFTLEKIDDTGNVITGNDAFSTTATTGENGQAVFERLNQGQYKLTETTTLDSYIKIEDYWIITVDEHGSVSYEKKESSQDENTRRLSGTFRSVNFNLLELGDGLIGSPLKAVGNADAISNENGTFNKQVSEVTGDKGLFNVTTTITGKGNTTTVSEPKPTNLIILLENSQNMSNYNSGQSNNSLSSLQTFLENIKSENPNVKVGLITYNGNSSYRVPDGNKQLESIDNVINNLKKTGLYTSGNNIDGVNGALDKAKLLLNNTSNNKVTNNIIVNIAYSQNRNISKDKINSLLDKSRIFYQIAANQNVVEYTGLNLGEKYQVIGVVNNNPNFGNLNSVIFPRMKGYLTTQKSLTTKTINNATLDDRFDSTKFELVKNSLNDSKASHIDGTEQITVNSLTLGEGETYTLSYQLRLNKYYWNNTPHKIKSASVSQEGSTIGTTQNPSVMVAPDKINIEASIQDAPTDLQSVTFELLKDGRVLETQNILGNGWFHTFTNKDPGNYEVKVTAIKPDGKYTANLVSSSENKFVFRLDVIPKISASIVVNGNGFTSADLVLKKDNAEKAKFNATPSNLSHDFIINEGSVDDYRVELENLETSNSNYKLEKDNEDNPRVFTLTFGKTVNLPVSLSNVPANLTSATLLLVKNGTDTAQEVILNAPGWSGGFSDLPKYENGREINYSFKLKSTDPESVKDDIDIDTSTGEAIIIQTPTITVANYKEESPKGKFQIMKVDEENTALSNAEFTLTKLDDLGKPLEGDGNVFKGTSAETTENKGRIIFENLQPGTYMLKETNAPEGYKLSEKVWMITVNDNGEVTVKIKENKDSTNTDSVILDENNSFEIQNNKNKIEFTKISGVESDNNSDGTPKTLQDAKFELRKDDGDGNFVKVTLPEGDTQETSDSEGKVFWKGLTQGDYEVHEMKAPDGYVLAGKVASFKVDNTGNIIDIKDKDGNAFSGNMDIVNFKAEYPSTGGMGSLIFTLIGSSLMLVAYMSLRRDKKLKVTGGER